MNGRGLRCGFVIWTVVVLPLLEGKTINGDPYLGTRREVRDWRLVSDLALSYAEECEDYYSDPHGRVDSVGIGFGLSRTIFACLCGDLVYAQYAPF